MQIQPPPTPGPAGVINFLPSDGLPFGEAVTQSPDLAAINFTGSTKLDFSRLLLACRTPLLLTSPLCFSSTFKWLWKAVGQNLDRYKTFPRLLGGEFAMGGERCLLFRTTAHHRNSMPTQPQRLEARTST